MINYNNIIKRNNLKVNKVTIKGKVTIIDTPLGKFLLKENKGIKIYNYLISRGFDYIPKIIDYDDEIIMFEYLEEIEYDYNEKAKDYIKLLSLLHLKTSYFQIDNNYYINTYEDIKNKLNKTYNYYDNLINNIESKIYMSPNEYYLIRNSSIIFSAINYCDYKLEEWYKTNKDNNKKRVVTLYNDIDLNNLIKTKDNIYLTSFNYTKIDNPIYDLLEFYNTYGNMVDFKSLLNVYESKYSLNKDEKDLLLIYMSIPDIIALKDDPNIKYMKDSINKIYNTLSILDSEKEKERKTH